MDSGDLHASGTGLNLGQAGGGCELQSKIHVTGSRETAAPYKPKGQVPVLCFGSS